jgi:hypothetical protein
MDKKEINLKTIQEWDAGQKAKKLKDVTPMPVDTTDVTKKAKTLRMIKADDMSPETKALPDEVSKPPKGIGSSEPDMKKGGSVKKMAKGGSVSSASKRADGCATKGKTKGRII